MFVVIFLVSVGFSLGLLRGITAKTQETSQELLPELVHTHNNLLKIEQIRSYIDLIYWVQNGNLERNYRLESQVLIHSFLFENDPFLASEASNILHDIREIASIRQLQRTLQNEAIQVLSAYHEPTVIKVRGLLSALPQREIREGQMPSAFDELTSLSSFEEIEQRILFISDLNRQLDWMLIDTKARLERVSTYLNSDAALKAQTLATDIGKDIERITQYSIVFMSIVVLLFLFLFFIFKNTLLRPIQSLVAGLKAIEQQGNQTIILKPLFFKELDTIRESIEDYSGLVFRMQKTNQELENLSRIDGLTGLANRRYLDEALQEEMNRAMRHQHAIALLMIDIDHFKRLNDQYGHQVGDHCLKVIAQVIKGYSQRTGELAARFGGEEFTLILPEITHSDVWRIAEAIREECSQRVIYLENDASVSIQMTVSIGFVYQIVDANDAADILLKTADQALYQAKAAGRNCVCEG
ncbi:GGDEF domain-containing protein [Nitrincola alkalisediminis]|nr:GGDEF domain-containing protein [Nitrincola alkalisediminis]